ncbi:MAG TPA: 5-formyltetrahydrofolate cyclo-ligase [Kiritimatiellia bacterium]|nr:5-formyltetrahydrofolate cyclo-ligase [Kiritimatiellia bacterium]HRX06996.1 5-formyltetrahydrofolate cyclo-ligase [Kiritimatiellia bacterium]
MKAALRRRIGTPRVPAAVSSAIQRRLMAEDWWAAAFAVGLYRATPFEPATDLLLADRLAAGALVAVPASAGRDYRWGGVEADTRWRKGRYGILEPEPARPVSAGCLQIAVVPGVAFDLQGGRLGHGGGHLDRLLSQTAGLLVGLCAEARLLKTVPLEPHDVPVDVVVTEKRIRFAPSAEAKLERLTG